MPDLLALNRSGPEAVHGSDDALSKKAEAAHRVAESGAEDARRRVRAAVRAAGPEVLHW